MFELSHRIQQQYKYKGGKNVNIAFTFPRQNWSNSSLNKYVYTLYIDKLIQFNQPN